MKISLWLKIYIICLALISAIFLGLNILAQGPTQNLNFCAKTENIILNTPRIVNCNLNYHIEGTSCVSNVTVPPPPPPTCPAGFTESTYAGKNACVITVNLPTMKLPATLGDQSTITPIGGNHVTLKAVWSGISDYYCPDGFTKNTTLKTCTFETDVSDAVKNAGLTLNTSWVSIDGTIGYNFNEGSGPNMIPIADNPCPANLRRGHNTPQTIGYCLTNYTAVWNASNIQNPGNHAIVRFDMYLNGESVSPWTCPAPLSGIVASCSYEVPDYYHNYAGFKLINTGNYPAAFSRASTTTPPFAPFVLGFTYTSP